MIILGFNILGNLNKAATSVESLGLPLWRIVIASGILTSIMGFFNIIAVSLSFESTSLKYILTNSQTYVFCDSKLGITGRQVRSHGATTTKETPSKSFSVSSGSTHRPASPVLPSYHTTTTTQERHKSRFGLKFPIRLSGISKPTVQDPDQFSKWDSRSSPVMPDVQRPPTAMHPAYGGVQYPASSRYSVASNVTRF